MNIQKNPEVDFIGDLSDLSQFQDESIEESGICFASFGCIDQIAATMGIIWYSIKYLEKFDLSRLIFLLSIVATPFSILQLNKFTIYNDDAYSTHHHYFSI